MGKSATRSNIFPANCNATTSSCQKHFACSTPFLQPTMQQNVALQVSRKVDLSSIYFSQLFKTNCCMRVSCQEKLRVTAPLNLAVFLRRKISLRCKLQGTLHRIAYSLAFIG